MEKFAYEHAASGNNVTFFGEFKNTRNGFKHVVTAFIEQPNGNVCERSHTCYYLNRTWECYPYQSAILGVCLDAIESELHNARAAFMAKYEYKRLNDKRRDEFRAYLMEFDAKTPLVFWCNVYAAYNGNFCNGKPTGFANAETPYYDKYNPLYFARF